MTNAWGACECSTRDGDPAAHDRTCPYVRGAMECSRCTTGKPRLTFILLAGEPVCSSCRRDDE